MPEVKIHGSGHRKRGNIAGSGTAGQGSVESAKKNAAFINILYGEFLLDALRTEGFRVYSPCGGAGTCGKCKVYLKDEGYITSCLFSVERDLEIFLPEPTEAHILASQYEHSTDLKLEPGVAAELSPSPHGIAIDIGTTTMAFHLIRLDTGSQLETRTRLNPQAQYGADVITRILYSMTNPDGLKILQSEVINVINLELDHFAETTGISPQDFVKVCIAGNTTMLHLLLGVNPKSLTLVPFTPVFTEEKNPKASDLNIHCNPDAVIKVLPSFSAYIGADIISGLASLDPDNSINNYLFIDVGTNGEMTLVTQEKIYACATAAGPAFEGSNIECGMGGLAGAISRYSSSGSYQTIGGTSPLGICGSGLIDLTASLLENGRIRADGYLEDNIEIVPADESGTSDAIYLTPKDIREIQLAKSAIASGINILIQRSGIPMESIDALYLAGGFGNYLRVESAVAIGMIPKKLSNKVIPVGNTSGTGAVLSVKSLSFDEIIREILGKINYIELSDDDNFLMEFAMNMDFPDLLIP